MSPRYINVTSSIRGHDYTICITQSQFIYSTNTKNLKECPKVSTGESRRKRVPTPMHRFPMSRKPQVGHLNIHQVARGIPLSPQISTVRHTSSVLKSLKTQSDKITSKGNLNSLQKRGGGGGRNIMGSKYNSKARDTSRSYHLKNTRERDQTHSYWYIPSAPRENYSLLVMESTGMMKMATGEGSLLRQGAGTGSRLVQCR